MIDLIDEELFISFIDYEIIDNHMYFSNQSFNAFMILDKNTNEVEYMQPFVEESLDKAYLHSGIKKFDNKLFFFSNNTSRIHMIELSDLEQKVIEIDDAKGGISKAEIYHGDLYFFFSNIENGIVRYDKKRESICHVEWFQLDGVEGIYDYCEIEDGIWFAGGTQDENYLIINLCEKSIQKYEGADKFFRMAYSANNIWYVSDDKCNIYSMSLVDKKTKKFELPIWDLLSVEGYVFLDIFLVGKTVYLVAGDYSGLYALNQAENKLDLVCDLEVFSVNNYLRNNYAMNIKAANDKIIYMFARKKEILTIDLNTNQINILKNEFEKQKMVRRYINKVNEIKGIIIPDVRMDIQEFIDNLW